MLQVLRGAAAIALGLALASGFAQESPDPTLLHVAGKLRSAEEPFTMVVHLTVKEGAAESFAAAFVPAILASRSEKGNLRYELNRDADDANVYLLYERWSTLEDLEAHLTSVHYKTLLGKVGGLLTAAPQIRVLFPVEGNRSSR